MNAILARVRTWMGPQHVLWTTPDVRRYFLVCKDCRRTVPVWHYLSSKVQKGHRIGCKCGGQMVTPRQVPTLSAAYWLFVRGFLVRRLIQRKTDWDPRIPYRADGSVA
jgi:hypothetical protein